MTDFTLKETFYDVQQVLRVDTVTHRISGYIVGNMWMPQSIGGIPCSENLRNVQERGERTTYEELLDFILTEKGGDFQNAQFSEDSEIIVEYRKPISPGKYMYVCKIIPVSKVAPDLIREGVFSYDFYND